MSFQYKSIINWYSSTLELPEFSTLDSLIDDFKIQGLYRLMRIFMKEVGKDFEANIEILRKRGMVNEDRRHLTENEFLLKLLSNIHTQYKTTQRHNKSFSFGNTNPKIYNWQKLSRNSSSNVSKQNLKPRGSFSAHLPSSSPYKITRSLGTSMNKIYLAQESQYLMDVTQTSSFSNDLKSRKLLQMERLSQNEERKLM